MDKTTIVKLLAACFFLSFVFNCAIKYFVCVRGMKIKQEPVNVYMCVCVGVCVNVRVNVCEWEGEKVYKNVAINPIQQMTFGYCCG